MITLVRTFLQFVIVFSRKTNVRPSLALHQTYWLFAYTHLEGVTDLIRGQVINDHVQDLLDVVVDEGLALVGDGGGHVRAQRLENVPTNI